MMIRSFIAAIAFLTRLPVPKLEITTDNWEKSPRYFPLVGFVIGCLLAITAFVSEKLLTDLMTACLLLIIWVWVTGGLHLDGWIDLFDAIGSNRSREEMLEILKDSRVGAMGAIAVIMLILVKMITIYELVVQAGPIVFLLPPLIARTVLIMAIHYWPYRKNNGIAQGLGKYLSTTIVVCYLIFLAIVTYALVQLFGVIIAVATILIGFLFIKMIYRQLGMLTGDCYGAIIEFVETVTLFLFAACWRLF